MSLSLDFCQLIKFIFARRNWSNIFKKVGERKWELKILPNSTLSVKFTGKLAKNPGMLFPELLLRNA